MVFCQPRLIPTSEVLHAVSLNRIVLDSSKATHFISYIQIRCVIWLYITSALLYIQCTNMVRFLGMVSAECCHWSVWLVHFLWWQYLFVVGLNHSAIHVVDSAGLAPKKMSLWFWTNVMYQNLVVSTLHAFWWHCFWKWKTQTVLLPWKLLQQNCKALGL